MVTEELCAPGEPTVPVEREPSPFPQAVQNLPAPSSKAQGSTSPKVGLKPDRPPGEVFVATTVSITAAIPMRGWPHHRRGAGGYVGGKR